MTVQVKDTSAANKLLDAQQQKLHELANTLRRLQNNTPVELQSDKDKLAAYLDQVASKINALDVELKTVADQYCTGQEPYRKQTSSSVPVSRIGTSAYRVESPSPPSWNRGISPAPVQRVMGAPTTPINVKTNGSAFTVGGSPYFGKPYGIPMTASPRSGSQTLPIQGTGSAGSQTLPVQATAQRPQSVEVPRVAASPTKMSLGARTRAASIQRRSPRLPGSANFTPASINCGVGLNVAQSVQQLSAVPAAQNRSASVLPQPTQPRSSYGQRSASVLPTSTIKSSPAPPKTPPMSVVPPVAGSPGPQLSATPKPIMNNMKQFTSTPQLSGVPSIPMLSGGPLLSGVPPMPLLSGVPPPQAPTSLYQTRSTSPGPPPSMLGTLGAPPGAPLASMKAGAPAFPGPPTFLSSPPLLSTGAPLISGGKAPQPTLAAGFQRIPSFDRNSSKAGSASYPQDPKQQAIRRDGASTPQANFPMPGRVQNDPRTMGTAPQMDDDDNEPLSDNAVKLQKKLGDLAAHDRRVL